MVSQPRSSQRLIPKRTDAEERLRHEIVELAKRYGRYGYRRITALLRRQARSQITIKVPPDTAFSIEYLPEGTDQVVLVDRASWSHKDSVWQGLLEPGQYLVRTADGKPRRLHVYAGLPTELEVQP